PNVLDETGESTDAVDNGLDVHKLRPDVHLDPNRVDKVEAARLSIQRDYVLSRHPKFALPKASRDIRVRLGINVGVYSHRDARNFALIVCDLAYQDQLGGRLDVECENVLVDRVGDFQSGLADASEDRSRGRK